MLAQIYEFDVLTPTQCSIGPCHMKSRFRKRLDMQACESLAPPLPRLRGFHESGVPIVKAELPNPSSCFIVPLSMGQSLSSMPSQSARFHSKSIRQGKMTQGWRTISKFQGGEERFNEIGVGTFCLF